VDHIIEEHELAPASEKDQHQHDQANYQGDQGQDHQPHGKSEREHLGEQLRSGFVHGFGGGR